MPRNKDSRSIGNKIFPISLRFPLYCSKTSCCDRTPGLPCAGHAGIVIRYVLQPANTSQAPDPCEAPRHGGSPPGRSSRLDQNQCHLLHSMIGRTLDLDAGEPSSNIIDRHARIALPDGVDADWNTKSEVARPMLSELSTASIVKNETCSCATSSVRHKDTSHR